MRRIVPSILLLIACATASVAQTYGYGFEGSIRRDRALFDKARTDLDHASRYPYASKSDVERFDLARRDLFDFESRFDEGRYDRHDLDKAIDRLDRVVTHNSLDPRDRGNLSDDLRMMRDFLKLHRR